MSNSILQIAINEHGELTSIFHAETGKKCNCFCPVCNEKLIAKNKNKSPNSTLREGQKEAHFAHYNGLDCKNAPETAIHLLAKKVLLDTKKLLLPNFGKVTLEKYNNGLVTFDSAEKEKRIEFENSYFQPDMVLAKNGKSLFIEFYKTHEVDDDKIVKIQKLNISCLEIDINFIEPLINGELNEQGLINSFENEITNKYWLHNSKLENKLKLQNNLKKEKELEIIKTDKIDEDDDEFLSSNNFINSIYLVNSYEDGDKLLKWKSKLINEGYKFLKIYTYPVYDYELSEYGRSYKRFDYNQENIYCPQFKNSPNKAVELSYCKTCEFHKSKVKNDLGDWCIACGYNNNLKQTI
ncbi:hypothetical protein [Yeosuana sp. AK3]